MSNHTKHDYQKVIERIFEKLGISTNLRTPEEEQRIKKAIYEALSQEILGFIYDSLDPLKRLAFKKDLDETRGDWEKIAGVISTYYQIIPQHRVRLEERLKVFETNLYHKLLSE